MPTPKYRVVGEFIGDQIDPIAEICASLDELFISYPNVSSKIRFNIPFYDYGTWICYINPITKTEEVELVFLRGKELQHIFPILEDKGRKMVAGIKIKEINDSLLEQVLMIWEEAMLLENN